MEHGIIFVKYEWISPDAGIFATVCPRNKTLIIIISVSEQQQKIDPISI